MSVRFVDALFWVSVGCCVIAQVAILVSVIRSTLRSSGSGPASAAASEGKRPHHGVAEIAWAVLPAFALAAVFFFTRQAMA